MRLYHIEMACFGSYVERDVNCPTDWRGSGCYDVERECYQEGEFDVAAEGLDEALRLIIDNWERLNTMWANSADEFWYDPDAVGSSDASGEGGEEILNFEFKTPVNGGDYDIPSRYKREVAI